MPIALFFEDLQPGDFWVSPEREVTADDVADFADLTGDHDPLHTDQLAGVESPFGGPVAHGLFGISVLAGLSSNHPKVATLALTGLRDWQFAAPVYFGDTVHVLTTVLEAVPHGRRAGQVTWQRQLINQHGRIAQSGTFVTLVRTRKWAARHGQSAAESSVSNGSEVPVAPRPSF